MTREPGVQVSVFEDHESQSRAAADLFVSTSQDSIAVRGVFTVALSGGSTPERFYTFLGSDPYRGRVNWQRVHVFWVDERAVPGKHPESNFKLAYDTFLSKASIPEKNVHRIRGEEGPEKAAEEYEDDLRRFFGMQVMPAFDLVILGVGEDGHTASLFPGSKALREKTRLAVPVYQQGRPKTDRVTLTLSVLNNAAHVLMLASGSTKADIAAGILEGDGEERYPAGYVKPVHGRLLWFLDREAASNLDHLVKSL